MDNINNSFKTKTKRLTYEQAFTLNGRIPPQAIELEESVLGGLLLDQDAVTNSIDIIKEEYFYNPEHREIFKAIRQLFQSSSPVDMLTVVQQLKKNGSLEMVGGAYKISSLTSKVTSGAHIEYHARILSEKFIQRELIRVSTETIKEAYEETTDVVNLLDKTETHLMEINDNNFRSDFQDTQSLVFQAMKEIEDAQKSGGRTTGVPTGFTELDKLTGGFHKGTLIILAARPAMGKTAFALSLARNMAVDFNIPVAFFSLEMTAIELMMRLISSETEIPGEALKKGDQLDNWQNEILKKGVEPLVKAPIYIDDTPQLSIFELRAKCRRLKQKYDIQMVFIDYLQLMHGGTDMKLGNREQEISTISRQLKALSKELNIPVLSLSQLSRAVETRGGSKKPMLSDLRESGAIEQDADIVMFIYRPEYYGMDSDDKGSTLGMADIILAKHRSGAVGEARLRFIAKFAKFTNSTQLETDIGGGALMPLNTDFDSSSQSFTVPSKMNSDLKEDDDLAPF
ncbi:MAG: replicative DNA helicase [Bacteroidales bacterium]|jgi:replicative DNA helicase|nr:replicative DNA helicase [Bacteroidales bacterium]MDY0054140.1 replicative DNA helicase [Bacteroidales bacterium]